MWTFYKVNDDAKHYMTASVFKEKIPV